MTVGKCEMTLLRQGYGRAQQVQINIMRLNKPRKDVKILNVELSSTSVGEVLDFVESSLKLRRKFFIVTPNPEMIVESTDNPVFLEALNTSDIALPDGVGLLLINSSLERITGREMMLKLFEFAGKRNLKVFLLGASATVNNWAVDKASKEFGGAKFDGDGILVIGRDGVPDTKLALSYEKDIVDRINKFGPDLLIVAFGAPKQELWVARNYNQLKVGGVMVVGGALDYYAGSKTLPPQFMARFGLEWLWRLLMEGGHYKRVWKATAVFLWMVLRERRT